LQPKKLALKIRELADEKKAEDIVVLDISKSSSLANYFVITHGNNTRHVRTIAEHVEAELKRQGESAYRSEGFQEGRWALLDYSSVILHVFYKDIREFYALERLWGDAKQVT